MQDFIAVAKALSDENRLRALVTLGGRELCACQIIELLALAPSTVSKHMLILRQAGLVESRKEGRWMYFRQSAKSKSLAVKGGLKWIEALSKTDPQREADEKRIKTILKINPVELCKKQNERCC